MRSPIKCIGGKFYIRDKIIECFPHHRVYVEVFGGAAHILFAKSPSEIEVYNDIDSGLVNFFRILKNKKRLNDLIRMLSLTPYSRYGYNYLRNLYYSNNLCDLYKAYALFCLIRQGIRGESRAFGFVTGENDHIFLGDNISSFLRAINSLFGICNRLSEVIIENRDFREIFKIYDSEDTLFYCDPPYLLETRKCKVYTNEMTRNDHEDLLEIVKSVKGSVILSGYSSKLYDDYLKGWSKIKFGTYLHSTVTYKGRERRQEIIWLSPDIDGQVVFGYK